MDGPCWVSDPGLWKWGDWQTENLLPHLSEAVSQDSAPTPNQASCQGGSWWDTALQRTSQPSGAGSVGWSDFLVGWYLLGYLQGKAGFGFGFKL